MGDELEISTGNVAGNVSSKIVPASRLIVLLDLFTRPPHVQPNNSLNPTPLRVRGEIKRQRRRGLAQALGRKARRGGIEVSSLMFLRSVGRLLITVLRRS